MGNGAEFLSGWAKGGQSEYTSLEPARIVGGVKGHLIKRRGDSDNHTNLPRYAATSEVYFRRNAKGVCQARVYLKNRMVLDFDWSHNHTNRGNGRTFKIGTIHVQQWQWHPDGSFTRVSADARMMNNAEIKRYGALIRSYCKDVKFR